MQIALKTSITPGNCIAFLTTLLLASCSYAAEEDTPEERVFGLGWLDGTQSVATSTANGLANQIDRFFGDPSSDLEAAYSSLRLTLEQRWHEHSNSDTNLRLRGKVYLPRIDERLSLLFSDDEGEGEDYYQQNSGENSDQGSIKANLQYNILDQLGERLDFRLGLRSSLKGKASLRYRHELPQGDNIEHRFAQTVFFVDADGFGSLSRYQLDLSVTDTSLLRWSNDLRFEEDVPGSQFSSELSYSRRLSDQTAMLYYLRMQARTNPSFIPGYNLGIRFRRSFVRPWLFMEFEPGHAWSKAAPDLKHLSSFYFFLRVEMAIGRI